jgi:C4-dicarboxylate-binding protein DctP
MVLVNARWWESLPKDIRAGLEAAVQVATRINNDIASKLNDEARDKIAASRLTTIHSMSAERRADWKWAMAPVWQAFEDFIGKDLIDAARKSNQPTVN